MWQSEKQQCQVIRALLKRIRLDNLWTATGPTREACNLLEAKGGYLSHGEGIYLRLAFDLWNGHGHATIGEILGTLDYSHQRAIAMLLFALAESRPRVEEWIASSDAERSGA